MEDEIKLDSRVKSALEEEYGFQNLKAMRNPYFSRLTQKMELSVPLSALRYFEKMSEEKNVPVETLVGFALLEMVENAEKLEESKEVLS